MRISSTGWLLVCSCLTACTASDNIAVGPSGKPLACVVDIDRTINDPNTSHHRKIRNQDPMANAQPVLQKLASRGIAIFYVSHRRISYLAETKKWMARYEFPPGAGLYLCDRDESKFQFKTRIIQMLQKDYDILFGLGDRGSDMKSYSACGIIALRVASPSAWLVADQRIQEIVDAASKGISSGRDVHNDHSHPTEGT